MDAVEKWLRDKAAVAPDDDPDLNQALVSYGVLVINALADEWHDKPPVALVPYQAQEPDMMNILDAHNDLADVEGWVWCDKEGGVHTDTLNPYEMDEENWCKPEDHQPLYTDTVDGNPLTGFLEHVKGPTMIGLDPTIYPACIQCSRAWLLRRERGVWAWFPDCAHKKASCKLVQA